MLVPLALRLRRELWSSVLFLCCPFSALLLHLDWLPLLLSLLPPPFLVLFGELLQFLSE
jgi:hypothetical protein